MSLLCLIWAESSVLADGSIFGPDDSEELAAGEELEPWGEYDSTLEENGPVSVAVKYAFLEPGGNSTLTAMTVTHGFGA